VIAKFLLVLLLEISISIAIVTWVVLHPGPLSIGALVVVGFGGIVIIATGAFHTLWRPMLTPFPAVEPAPDAVRRRFQSFGIGIVNMGLSIHVAADETYLHMTPLKIWQKLGANPVSIPWSAMTPIGHRGRVVRVNGHRLDGPKWCMELAGSPEE
jgi:hypothetical protein